MRKIYSFNKLLLSATATLCFSLANFAQVNFTANPNNGCAPLLVNFTYTGSPSGNYFKWNFGDGDTSILKNPSHTFINPINGPGYNVMLQVWDTTNKSMIYIGQNQMQVQVGGATDFTITSASSCPGEAVNFNFNQGSYNSISWDYGDGSTNNDFWCCPSHIFNNAGTYNVKVTVNTISCGTKMLTKQVVVGNTAKPEFSITANLSQVCINDQVFFSTSYKAASYLWSFGDATTSNQSNPTHSYSTPGNKRVILTATNSCGGTNADTIYVNVLSSGLPINSSFNVFPNPVCPNSAVNFNNNSSGTSYLWDLGDGTISTQRNVSYFYSNSGTYNVRLIVTKGCGNSDTIAQILTVGSGGPNNGKPNIYFQNNNGNSDTIISCPGINVSFGNGNNTNDKTTYLWKFGDGATSTLKYPAHTFTATGLHKIYLVVTNGCGQSDSSNYKYVKIDPNMGNSANLMAIPDSICPGGIVYFFDDDNGSNSTGNIYTIDFGDGTGADNITGPIDSVIGVLAAHVYSTPGSYTYKFYVTNLCGKEDSIVKTITVGVPGPKQPFYFVDNTTSNQNGGGDNSGCPGDAVRFTAVGGITYKWLFGDGKTSTDQIAYHAYADTGTYFAKCVITNACGKTDTVPTTAIIKRTNIPQAYFTTDKSFACSTDSIHFIYQGYQGNDKPNANNYIWDFGDGNTSTLLSPWHTYSAKGAYPVSLTVTNGCGSSMQTNINVLIDKPTVAITSLNSGYCSYDASVSLFGTPGGGLFKVDGSPTATLAPPLLTDGVHNVTYSYTNANGCSATATQQVTITKVIANAGPDVFICPGGSAQLNATGGGTYSWSPATGLSSTTIANPVITPSSGGSYTVTVTRNGCVNTDVLVVSLGASLVADPGSNTAICKGDSITLNGSGGGSYAWTPSATLSDATIPNPVATPTISMTYTLTVSSGGCSNSKAVTIIVNPTPTLTPAIQDVSCNKGTDGSITATPVGGTVPFTYTWSNGANTQTIGGLSAGTYTITVSDSKGCMGTTTAVVSEPTAINVSTSVVNVGCKGESSGSVSANVTGGVPVYTYLWGPGSATSQTVTNLAVGCFTITVTDANACAKTTTACITEPANSLTLYQTSTDAGCGGCSDGTATIYASGGTPVYIYTWSNGGTTSSINGLAPNTYTVTVTDANGCTNTATVTIGVQTGIASTETEAGNISIYPNPNNGTFVISISDLNSSAEFSLSDVAGKKVYGKWLPNTKTFTDNISLNDFAGGVYFAKLVTSTGLVNVKKIVINR